MEVFSIFNQYWFTWYPPPLHPPTHSHCTNLCHSKKILEPLEHFGRYDWKNSTDLKIQRGSVWGLLSHSACCLTRKSLRGLNLNRAFWNTDYRVALEQLKLISVWLCESCHLNDMPEPFPAPQEGFGGGEEGVADQAFWNHKWLGSRREEEEEEMVEDLSGRRGAAAKQQFSHVSLIKLVDIWKEMEERQRKRGRDEGQREEAAEQRVPTSENWLMRLPLSHQVKVSRL